MNGLQLLSEKNAEADETIEKGGTLGEYIAVIVTALFFAGIDVFKEFHSAAIVPPPWVDNVAKVEPTVLSSLLLSYVIFERLKVLGPTKRKIERIERTCKRLNSIPTDSEVSRLLGVATASVVDQLSSAVTVKINDSAEATYTHFLRILDSVETAKPHTIKILRHAIFHAESARDTVKEDDQPYFADFVQRMKAVSASDGSDRWDVRTLYNVTHVDRLNVILGRLSLGKVGYRVRSMCLPDFFPVFSPMIVDDQHVFLAVLEEGKNRVSKSVYMHGDKAARLFADYFDVLWADSRRVKTLAEDGTINEEGIKELTVAVNNVRNCSHI